MAMEFRLNRKEIARILKEEFNEEVDALAAKIAAEAGGDAEVEHYTTDRGAASVAVPTYQQAKDGRLTKACSKAGVEFKAKK